MYEQNMYVETFMNSCFPCLFYAVLQDEDKAVIRLKRYIALCGVRRNYKKLLDGCRSTRAKVAVLKKELEDLGVHGQWLLPDR